MFPFFEQNNIKFSCFHSCPPTYPIHFHKETEFFYILHGTVDVDINGISTRMQAGDFAVIFPGLLHEYRAITEKSTALLVLFQPELVADYTLLLQNYEPHSPVVSHPACHSDINFAMMQLWGETRHATSDAKIYSAYLQLLLARTVSQLALCPRKELPHNNILYQVVEYLTENFTQHLTLSDTASACGISKYYLSRLFSQQMHMSFHDYLNTLRVNDAQTKLRTTQFSITDISYQCGFENPRSFNRNFVRIIGMTPREYRNLHI